MDIRFIGRESYLQQISDHMLHIMSGQPRILLLEGQAGVGKSRFLREIRLLSHDLGIQIYHGYGTDTFSRPYAPFDALLPALQSEGGLSDAHPAATALLPTISVRTPYEPAFAGTLSDQVRFMMGVTNATASLASQSPVLVMVDDLHLADASSLELFGYLAGDLAERRTAPVLLLGSYRPQAAETPLGTVLSRLREQPITREIQLSGFHELETRTFIEAVGHQPATQQLVDRVHSVTRGVPFFVEQLMLLLSHQRALVDRSGYLGLQDTAVDDAALPQTPEGMIGPRLESLSASVRDCLTRGAFLIEPFSARKLASVMSINAADTECALELALEQGILVGEPESLQFVHALVRQVLQSRVNLPERHQTHLDIARALERFYDDSRENHILEIAHHTFEAGALVDVDHAVAVTQQGGDQAMSMYAWGEAARYYEAARLAMESRGGHSPAELALYSYQAALAHYRNQDVGPAQERFEQASQAYQESGNHVGLTWSLIWLTRLDFMHASTPFGVMTPHAQRLSEALSHLGTSEPTLRGYLMETLAQALRHGRQADEANDLAQQALSIGQEQNDPRLIAKASGALGLSILSRLEIERAIESLTVAVRCAREAHDLFLESQALSLLPHALHLKGNFDVAQARAIEGAETTRSLQDWGVRSTCLSHLAGVAAARGELATVEQLVQDALAMAKRSRYPWGAFRALQTWAFALAVRGLRQEADDVLDMITEAGVIFRETGHYERLLTRVFKQLGRLYGGEMPSEPIAPLCRDFAQVARRDTYSLGPLCATIELAELTLNPSLVEESVAILSLALERGALFTSGWVFCIPRVLGVAAVLREEWEVAAAHFAHALRVTQEVQAWPEYGRVCLDYAHMTLLIREPERYHGAMDAASQAIDLLSELGMSLHARLGADLQEALISRIRRPVEGQPGTGWMTVCLRTKTARANLNRSL